MDKRTRTQKTTIVLCKYAPVPIPIIIQIMRKCKIDFYGIYALR